MSDNKIVRQLSISRGRKYEIFTCIGQSITSLCRVVDSFTLKSLWRRRITVSVRVKMQPVASARWGLPASRRALSDDIRAKADESLRHWRWVSIRRHRRWVRHLTVWGFDVWFRWRGEDLEVSRRHSFVAPVENWFGSYIPRPDLSSNKSSQVNVSYLEWKVRNIHAVDEDSPSCEWMKTQQRRQQRAFPTSGATDDQHVFPSTDGQTDTVQCLQLRVWRRECLEWLI